MSNLFSFVFNLQGCVKKNTEIDPVKPAAEVPKSVHKRAESVHVQTETCRGTLYNPSVTHARTHTHSMTYPHTDVHTHTHSHTPVFISPPHTHTHSHSLALSVSHTHTRAVVTRGSLSR